MGADLLTLANNHVYDFGKVAFNDMLDSLDEYKMPYIGAGRNITEAKKPYYFILNGYKIAFVNATRAEKYILTPEATETDGGVFRCYDEEPLKKVISETKKDSDYLILLVHWGKEDSHELEDVQITTSKLYIDAGADVIVGTHAHVLQGIDFYDHKPIVYNLGDFIFNDETKDTGIFQIKFDDDGKMSYYFIPAKEENEYTKILYDDEKQRVIDNMNSWSNNSTIDKDGKITEK
jgi:poly-gamma-glutamate synthesis protein (capsule biosynthesis protein)